MRQKKPRPLDRMLLRLLLSRLFLPSLVITLLAVGLTAYVRARSLETQQLLLSRSLAHTVDDYLEHAVRVLGTVAQVAETATPEELAPYMYATWQTYGYFDMLYWLDESGTIIRMAPPDYRYQGLDMSGQPPFQQVGAQPDVTISPPFTSLHTGQPAVCMVWSLTSGGMMVGELNLEELQQTITTGGDEYYFITDRSGTLLAHPQSDLVAQQTNVSDMQIVQRGLDDEATLFYAADGTFVLGSATQVESTGWVVVTQTPLSVAYGPYVGSMGLALLLAPLVWLVMILNYRLQLRHHVVAPLAHLSQGADAMAAGDFAQGVALTAIPTAFAEVGTLVASFERMSQAVQARQEALRESEERFRTVADFTYGWEYWIGPEGDHIYVSPSCARITGYRADEFLRDPRLLERITHPDDRAMVARHVHEGLGSGEVSSIDFRIITRSGKQRWIGHICQPAYGTDGSWLGRRGSNHDITARKRAEQQLQQRAAELEEANAELSQYAYVVSHDLKTPLRAVHNYADFLREDLEATLDGDQKVYLDGLGRAVQEAEELVEDLLELSRVGRRGIPIETVDVGAFLRKLLAILSLPADVEIVMADDWPTMEVEPVLLGQIFQNLIGNAVKFNTSPHKRVELGWRPATPDLTGFPKPVRSQWYEFSVRDNGIGIDPRYHEQIFRVFERLHTKEEYEGTGVGLAIVKKAASKLGGSVRVESIPGEGSTFFVMVPRTPKDVERRA